MRVCVCVCVCGSIPCADTQRIPKCQPPELPRSWEIPTHGKFIRLSFVRPELVYTHHQRLNNMMVLDDQGNDDFQSCVGVVFLFVYAAYGGRQDAKLLSRPKWTCRR